MAQHFPEELKHLYNEVEFIGSGGFARVYKAKRRDGRIVAVKIPVNMDEAIGKSFLREITSWQRLNHMNIVSLLDANILPIPYLEQEYMESGNLESPKKPFDVSKACEIVFDIAEGLKYAHKQGIVHRDLKPQNILLSEDGTPKITDWGLSKFMAESRSLTPHGYTPAYAAPEQISPKKFGKPDERTDIYQLGVIFYNLLTNDLPFKGEDLIEIVFAILNEMPAAPSELNHEAKEVDHIVLRCLMKHKEERYQSAEELQKDLEKFIKPKQKPEVVQEKLQQKTALKEKTNIERERIPERREASKVPKKNEKKSLQKYFAIVAVLIIALAALYIILSPHPPPGPPGTPDQTPIVSKTPAAILPSNFTNSVSIEFVQIPAGEFDMGSPQKEAGRDDDEGPVHRVKIANAFYMSKYEITQKQWHDVMGSNVSFFKGDNLPVEQVSWNEAQEFISRLNEKEGIDKYRLPSEAEWEYAARAGNTTRYYFGDDASKLDEYEWFIGNSEFKTHGAGQKKSNPWGLYDMHGNVWEWVQDVYHVSYVGAPTDGSAWEGNGTHRIIRGGSFDYAAVHLRAANRNDRDPGFRHINTGFRLVMDS
jgi:formylglycine-generating enzyme required for sulfatase activity